MRFDDRLLTATAMARQSAGDTAARWTQLVDLLAQPEGLPEGHRATTLAEAFRLAPHVNVSRRQSVARSVAARAASADIVELFANETPKVAAPVLLGAKLSDHDWQSLIPRLPAPSRSLLRQRRDLPPLAVAALMAFGASDFALPDARVQSAELTKVLIDDHPETGGVSRISDLVARIETWRTQRSSGGQSAIAHAQPDTSLTIDRFHFETDAAGHFVWVSGAPSVGMIGHSLAEPGDAVWGGVDAATADAVARRDEIHGGRLVLPGETVFSGLWLITALPLTEPKTERHAGYVGIARRPVPEAAVEPSATPSHDIVRQVVHELRSPLNAIRGFAELIEHQIAGPVSQPYRQRAAAIVSEAAALVTIIDTIDAKARRSDRSGEAMASA